MHPSAYALAAGFRDQLPAGSPLRIADVGSYNVNGCMRPLFEAPPWTYMGFDIAAGPNVDVVLSGDDDWRLPGQYREAFDVVLANQVLEHVRAPWRWIKDVASLCKPGGLVWICSPNSWPFHEHPVDCWRVWPDGMGALFEEAGLVELNCFHRGPDTVGLARKPDGGQK